VKFMRRGRREDWDEKTKKKIQTVPEITMRPDIHLVYRTPVLAPTLYNIPRSLLFIYFSTVARRCYLWNPILHRLLLKHIIPPEPHTYTYTCVRACVFVCVCVCTCTIRPNCTKSVRTTVCIYYGTQCCVRRARGRY
jgi:hypothetical protein